MGYRSPRQATPSIGIHVYLSSSLAQISLISSGLIILFVTPSLLLHVFNLSNQLLALRSEHGLVSRFGHPARLLLRKCQPRNSPITRNPYDENWGRTKRTTKMTLGTPRALSFLTAKRYTTRKKLKKRYQRIRKLSKQRQSDTENEHKRHRDLDRS